MAEAKYTWGDIIIDPTSDRAKEAVGKQVYYSQFPNVCLLRANNDDRVLQGILVSIDPKNSLGSFIVDGSPYACIIVKKEEPKPKYVPFESQQEFISAYYKANNGIITNTESMLSCFGMWLKCDEHYELVTYIGNNGITIDGISINWKTLFESYTFLNGSPVGKEVKEWVTTN